MSARPPASQQQRMKAQRALLQRSIDAQKNKGPFPVITTGMLGTRKSSQVRVPNIQSIDFDGTIKLVGNGNKWTLKDPTKIGIVRQAWQTFTEGNAKIWDVDRRLSLLSARSGGYMGPSSGVGGAGRRTSQVAQAAKAGQAAKTGQAAKAGQVKLLKMNQMKQVLYSLDPSIEAARPKFKDATHTGQSAAQFKGRVDTHKTTYAGTLTGGGHILAAIGGIVTDPENIFAKLKPAEKAGYISELLAVIQKYDDIANPKKKAAQATQQDQWAGL